MMLAMLLLALAAHGAQLPRGLRAIWITRFDFQTADDVRSIVSNCAEAGFDTLLFQVRGNATAFYRSSLEPWAAELGGEDPGFDPLALALEESRARGLALHAWVNVVPAWWGSEPPSDPRQVVNAHPEWMWFDQDGERQPFQERFYVSLNPCLPDVRAYLAAVIAEIAERYDVDGIHLDYLRFPNEAPVIPAGSALDYPRDARTLELFRAATGLTPEGDREAWDRWRSAQVTELLREIRRAVKTKKKGLPLSAAVGADLVRAVSHFQDFERWVTEGLLDLAFPMNYTADEVIFGDRLEAWLARDRRVRVVMGVQLGLAQDELRLRQMGLVRETLGDLALFSYAALFDSRNTVHEAQGDAERRARAVRRELLLPHLNPAGSR